MRYFLTFLLVLSLGVVLFSQNFGGGFSFYLPPDDSSAQRFLPVFPAQPVTDFVRVGPDGHFAAGGRPIRFWGVNLTTGACFPYPERAPAVAARLRKMGINLVRFHHMDNPWTGPEGTIFRRDGGSTRRLNPVTLDRLHFFLAQLGRNGIYANINLHVSRTFTPADGVLYADSIAEFGKAVTMFDRQLIGLQKEYARQLLTAPNTYTGRPLAVDPVMAMVEITNENTIYGFWRDDALRPFAAGGLLLRRHADTLDGRWQAFLRTRYADDEALRRAWAPAASPGSDEQIADGGFETTPPAPQWVLEQHEGAAAAVTVDAATPYAGRSAARVQVSRATGTDWHVQFKRTALSLQRDSLYVVRFAARADRPRSISLTIQRDNASYTWYAGRAVELTTQWQTFTYTFTAPETNSSQVRLSFGLGAAAGVVWFDAVSLGVPVPEGLAPGESLAAGSVRRLLYSERLLYSPARVADQAAFYVGLQAQYYDEMYRYLRDSLGVRVPITGSNALGGPAEVRSMQGLDYIDDHAYWDHPWFPGEPWSATDWLISNTPMLREAGLPTVSGLFGGLALAGKPYTVSEYNHPFPNRYQTEMMPVLTAYSAFHGADGLMFFEYHGGDPGEWTRDLIGGFFGIHRNSAVMALSPVFGYAFREGLLRAGTPIKLNYPDTYLYGRVPRLDNNGRWGKFLPYDGALALTLALRTAGFSPAPAPDLPALPAPGAGPFTTSTGETTFDPARGLLGIEAPRLASLAGNLPGATGQAAGSLRLESASDFGVLAWLALDEQPLEQSRRSLLTLSSRAQNTGMVWDGANTVRDQWGRPPTLVQPLLVTCSLRLAADSLRLYLLDATGRERSSRSYRPGPDGVFRLTLDQAADRTLWYGVEVFYTATSRDDSPPAPIDMRLFPNPARETLWVEYRLPGRSNPMRGEILDAGGRLLQTIDWPATGDGIQRQTMDVENLPPGTYWLRLRTGERTGVQCWLRQ